jgi:hypothetical protein
MKYTINGKEYTEFDINKRCGELMNLSLEYPLFNDEPYHRFSSNGKIHLGVYEPTTNPLHTWPIIEKCWAELNEWYTTKGETLMDEDSIFDLFGTRWEYLMYMRNCTKLVAACICFIEISEAT